MWQGSCQRCGPGVRADVCPGASLSLPRAEIPGCMPSHLTQELASAPRRVTRCSDPSLTLIWPGDSCGILLGTDLLLQPQAWSQHSKTVEGS